MVLCLLALSDMVDLSEALDMEALLEALDMEALSEALDMLVWLEEGWLAQLPRWPVSTDLHSVESTGAKNNHSIMLCFDAKQDKKIHTSLQCKC